MRRAESSGPAAVFPNPVQRGGLMVPASSQHETGAVLLGRGQAGKARDFGSRIRRFESFRPNQSPASAPGAAPARWFVALRLTCFL